MPRIAIIAGLAIGVVVAAVLNKDKLGAARAKAMNVWEGPQVQGALTRADRFVADKAPALHGVGEAVVDAIPRRKAS